MAFLLISISLWSVFFPSNLSFNITLTFCNSLSTFDPLPRPHSLQMISLFFPIWYHPLYSQSLITLYLSFSYISFWALPLSFPSELSLWSVLWPHSLISLYQMSLFYFPSNFPFDITLWPFTFWLLSIFFWSLPMSWPPDLYFEAILWSLTIKWHYYLRIYIRCTWSISIKFKW